MKLQETTLREDIYAENKELAESGDYSGLQKVMQHYTEGYIII